jgi:hypothetical protein
VDSDVLLRPPKIKCVFNAISVGGKHAGEKMQQRCWRMWFHFGCWVPPLSVHKNERHVLMAEKIDALHTEEKRVFVAVVATHFSPPL